MVRPTRKTTTEKAAPAKGPKKLSKDLPRASSQEIKDNRSEQVAKSTENEILHDFEKYKERYGKKYSNKKEEDRRRKIFLANCDGIAEHNRRYVDGLASFHRELRGEEDLSDGEVARVSGSLQPRRRTYSETLTQPKDTTAKKAAKPAAKTTTRKGPAAKKAKK